MYNILYDNPDEDIFTRLLKIRNVEENIENFLNPSFANYWLDPFLLSDIDKSIDRIEVAMKKNEKIMIFGDYDVDGITSSYLLYTFFTKFLWYKNISIRLPNRLEDWYWIKINHIDELHKLNVDLIITVDNWITAIKEAIHAKNLWIDMIITDHHKNLDQVPDAFAIINPHVSEKYPFKFLAWVWVAFKFASAISNRLIKDPQTKKDIINYLMPIVSIGTVADCVPLINENRLFVKMGLDLINEKKWIPNSITNLLKYLNIKTKIETFHIWYMIAPRLNASWRMVTPYESLFCLLNWDSEKQCQYLDKMEELNTKRKKLQDELLKKAEASIDTEKKILIFADEEMHDGIIWLVAWRLTEKHHKPSVIITLKPQEGLATASLRGPDYFDIVKMLEKAGKLLITFWWHKQAWWMTCKLADLPTVTQIFEDYCDKKIKQKDIKKTTNIDTYLYEWELQKNSLENIDRLAPFGEWNQEPIFMIEKTVVNSVEKVWKNWWAHLKVHVNKWDNKFPVMFRWKWSQIDTIEKNVEKNIVWKIKTDTFNWGFFIDWVDII